MPKSVDNDVVAPTTNVIDATDLELSPSNHDDSHSNLTGKDRFDEVVVTPRWFLALAALFMLISATFDTTATKYMNRQKLPACDGCEPTYFEAPFFQTWTGYIGELVFLPIFFIDAHYAKKHNRNRRFDFITSRAELKKPHCPYWVWIFPLLLDFVSTACLNYATMLTQASTVQMLRSFNIILTFFLSAFFLENRIYIHQIIGVVLVLVGMILVGMYAILNPDTNTNYGDLQWLGIVTALVGTGTSALQWVMEEKIFRKYFCSPFEGVGWMGFYGTILGGVVLGIGQASGFEDVKGAFYQMGLGEKGSTILIVFNVLYIISLAINTASGITVTKLASSLLRTIVNAGRTVSIWAIEMIVGWSTFEPLNFSGLVIIIAAMAIYNYNYITSQRSHWFADNTLRSSPACLPNKVEVTNRDPLADAATDTSSMVAVEEKTTTPVRRRKYSEKVSSSKLSHQVKNSEMAEISAPPTDKL